MSPIELRAISEYNLPDLLSWRNDERIYKWCRQRDLISEDEHQDWFDSLKSNPKIKMFEIHYIQPDTDELIGVCGLTDIDLYNQRAEFSLYIAPKFQEKGFGQMSLITLLKHGFKNYPLNVIYGECFDGNGAYKMFLDIGFKHEGTRRDFYFKNGKFIDARLVSIKRSEFLEIHGC